MTKSVNVMRPSTCGCILVCSYDNEKDTFTGIANDGRGNSTQACSLHNALTDPDQIYQAAISDNKAANILQAQKDAVDEAAEQQKQAIDLINIIKLAPAENLADLATAVSDSQLNKVSVDGG